MTSLPSSPEDAAAQAVEQRLTNVQTILTDVLPAAITEQKRHDSIVTISRQ
jgi:hypothetical protein